MVTRTRSGSASALWLGALGSVVLHAALLSVPLRLPFVETDAAHGPPDRPADVMRVVSLSDEPIDRDVPDRPDRPVQHPRPADSAPAVDRADRPFETEADAVPSPRPSTTPLAPRLRDGRLWRDRDLARADTEPWAVEEVSVAAGIRAASVSAASAGAADTGMGAIVVTDGAGRRWGASPGRFHLGSLPLPTCLGDGVNARDCGFGAHPDARRGGLDARVAVTEEIPLQATRHTVDSTWQDRARAIRQRRDAERPFAPRRRRR